MDIWALIVGLGIIIGIVAGIVQVLDYLEKRRAEKARPVPVEVATPSSPAPAVPSNLPPRGEFIGREKEKTRVREALASRWPLTCIDGIGGIGKTALALEVTGECLQASKDEIPADSIPTFDGFIWTTAKDRELTLNDVLDAIARTLDYPGIAQQPLEEKQESVRKLLQSKRYLLLVDNFETVKDDTVRDFLLRLPEPSRALITSREQKLRQAWVVSLKGLEQAEALTLIRSEGRRLGLASVEKGEERVLFPLYQATGGAPLAIKWAVGQIKQKGQSLDSVLAALHEAKGDIFEEVFARSWSLLTEEARRILMVMPIFAASASRDAIEAASDVHHYALDEGLGQLVEMWLVEATDELDEAKRRYNVHPLTRTYARARLSEDEGWETHARARVNHYLLNLVRECGGESYWDGYFNWPHYDTLEVEWENVLAIMDWCYATKQWHAVVDYLIALVHFWSYRGYWHERIAQGQNALEAARQLGDQEVEAWLLVNGLGWLYFQQGNLRKAASIIAEGQAIAEAYALNDAVVRAECLLSRIARELGNYETAQEHLKKAVSIPCRSPVKERLHIELGVLAYCCNDYGGAVREYEEALRLGRQSGDSNLIAKALALSGHAARAQGQIEKARLFFEDSLQKSMEMRWPESIARAEYGLATIEAIEGNTESSLVHAKSALHIFERLALKRDTEETQGLVKRLEKESADR